MALVPIPPQDFVIRAGDDLPTFAAVIEDEYGNPVDLTDATVRLVADSEVAHEPTLAAEVFVENPTAGVITFDWDRRVTTVLAPGVYQLYAIAEWPNGYRLTAPSDRSATLTIRPGLVALLATADGRDLLTADGFQYVVDFGIEVIP